MAFSVGTASKGLKFNARDVTRIKKYLKDYPKVVQAAARKALAAEARIIYEKSQQIVPVITGTLKSSGHVGRASSKGTATFVDVYYEVKKIRPGRKEHFNYAQVVEEGRTGYRPFSGRFYLRRAVNSTRNGRPKRLAQFVRKEIKGKGFRR